jgi:hypothetical protein
VFQAYLRQILSRKTEEKGAQAVHLGSWRVLRLMVKLRYELYSLLYDYKR